MSTGARNLGLAFLAGTLPWVLWAVWEKTWLTWHQGPQMIGFSLVHAFPYVLVVGALSWVAMLVWCIAIAVTMLERRSLARRDYILIIVSLITLACPFIPYHAWQAATDWVLGTSPKAPDTLAHAAATGDSRTVARLLDRGISPNAAVWHGCTALVAAARVKNPGIASLLIRHGANPDAICEGETALHRAAENGDVATAKLLINAGASTSVRNARGFTPADLAWANNHPELVPLLERSSN